MIKYSDYKRFYAETGLFTLTGSNYEGYVEVLSGVPYVASTIGDLSLKCITSDPTLNQPLERLNTYKTDLLCSKFFFDRAINDNITLPYALNDILIEANDFLNYDLLKDKLSKIKDNTTYTYSRFFVTDSNLPSSPILKYAGILNVTDTSLSVLSGSFYNTIEFINTDNFKFISDIKGFVPVNYTYDETHAAIFAYTDTSIITLSCNDQSIGIIETSPYYQTQTQENILTFSSIGGMAVVNNNLYVTDTGNDIVLKYDISGYINGDTVLANKRNLLEIIGGRGRAQDNLLFNQPKEIAAGNDYIAVNDSYNRVVKIYDLDFNFKARITKINFKSEPLAAIEFNKLYDLLYILTYYGTGFKLYILDQCFDILNTQILTVTLRSDEYVNDITFSYNDSNHFYICTNYTVYKYFTNKLTSVQGGYQTEQLLANVKAPTVSHYEVNNYWNYATMQWGNALFNWDTSVVIDTIQNKAPTKNGVFSDVLAGYKITSQTSNYDKLFFISQTKIYYFKEPNLVKTVLKLPNFDNFGSVFTLNPNEYIQGSSLNKEIYKLMYDIINLKNNIIGRFTGSYDALNVFIYNDYNYNIDLTQLYNNTNYEYFIHDNEKNITGVINRTIRKIYDLQLQLITLTQPDKGDEIAPVYNAGSGDPSNTLIIE